MLLYIPLPCQVCSLVRFDWCTWLRQGADPQGLAYRLLSLLPAFPSLTAAVMLQNGAMRRLMSTHSRWWRLLCFMILFSLTATLLLPGTGGLLKMEWRFIKIHHLYICSRDFTVIKIIPTLWFVMSRAMQLLFSGKYKTLRWVGLLKMHAFFGTPFLPFPITNNYLNVILFRALCICKVAESLL